MIENDKVRSVVARFFGVPEGEMTESFSFPTSRLHGSVGRATLHAAIKRIAGIDLPAAFSANTFGELLSPVAATPMEAASAPVVVSAPVSAEPSAGIGIDIEHSDHLPTVTDPWSEPFYVENFTPAEIAYCLRQPDPKESFCGLWSAKEAVKKSGAEFLALRPLEIEITHDAAGRPVLLGGTAGRLFREKNCLISISHSRGTSTAVCVAGLYPKGNQDRPADISPSSTSGVSAANFILLGLFLGVLNVILWLIFHGKK